MTNPLDALTRARSAKAPMPAQELLELVLVALDDGKARDSKVLDVRGKTSLTDFHVVASGTSDRHVRAVANHVEEKAREAGVRPLGTEGEAGGDWVLVDLGDVVVHVMKPETREFYQLEKLWSTESFSSAA